jgi:hypothetical protein
MKRNSESATVSINGRNVLVEWTSSAAVALAKREAPLIVELELYFSCLIKKFVHFRDDSRGKDTVAANEKLLLYFRPVTSAACRIEDATALGRQPEIELDSNAVMKIAPRKVCLDHVKGVWRGSYSL